MSGAGGAIGPTGRPLRVLHVYKTYYPDSLGGVEQVILQLTTALQPLGIESRVLTLSANPVPRILARPEGEVIRCKTTLEIASNPLSWEALRNFRRHCAWADVVHYQFPWPFADLMHLVRRPGLPSVVTYQSDIVRQQALLKAYRPLMMAFLRSVSRVVATSPNYLATSPVLGALRRTVDVIPNGLAEQAVSEGITRARQRWHKELGTGFYLFVGVLRYYKGLDTLLEAARGFPRRIVIAGSGPEMERLVAKAARLGLSNVSFLGNVSDDDKAALLDLAAAFVFPSHLRSEAFGMSLVEAAMSGTPMVSCDIGTGTSFINEDGVTGWTVPPENPDAFRAGMQRLAGDDEQTAQMGLAAKNRYQRLFTAQAMAASYATLYREIA